MFKLRRVITPNIVISRAGRKEGAQTTGRRAKSKALSGDILVEVITKNGETQWVRLAETYDITD